MEIQFTIVRSENKEYLCYKAGEAYVDASNPMIAFATGEDEFEIVEPDSSFRQKEYEFRGEQYYLVPEFYRNGWLALTLVMVEDEDEYIVLSVNLVGKWTHSVCRTVHLSTSIITPKQWSSGERTEPIPSISAGAASWNTLWLC